MDTTAESFRITLSEIASDAHKLGLLAAGVTLEYRHNGAGHPPYVYAIASGDSEGADTLARLATRDASEFLPVFTYKFTRRESMAALEACARALSHVARFQGARVRELVFCEAHNPKGTLPIAHLETSECVHPHYSGHYAR